MMNCGSDIDCRLDSQRRGGGDAQSGTCGLHESLVQEALGGLIHSIFHL